MRISRRSWLRFGLASLTFPWYPNIAAFGDDPPSPLKLTGWPRKLTWDDFRVVETARDDRHDRDAGFYSSFEVTDSEYKRPAPSIFQVRTLTIQITIEDDRWVRRGRQSAALLAHEQGHFDVTGLAAHTLARALFRLRADSVDSLRKKGAQTAHDHAALCQRWNQQYDDETNHGLDKKAQRRWSDRIARAIEADHASLDDPPDDPKPPTIRRKPT